jgi:hypothetical protein
VSNLWSPGAFQGTLKKKGYFEGWYFKSVTADERAAYAVIPGISLARDPADSHAFVMFLDARSRRMSYFRYPVADFNAARDRMDIRVGLSRFSPGGMKLDLEGDRRITGELRFSDIHPWPVTLLSPGAMGWYAFVPFMECYHGVLSFDHDVSGRFEVDGETKDFSGGKGYIEKDWGASMPSSWVWMQANHFDEDGVSLTGSVAKIPWLGRHFTGFLFGVYYHGQVYRLATYTGARLRRLDVTESRVEIVVDDPDYVLEIGADRPKGADLAAPSLGAMTSRVNEALDARVDLRLTQKARCGDLPVFSGTGRNAGLEVKGDMGELVRVLRKQ